MTTSNDKVALETNPCKTCSRPFTVGERLIKHEEVCVKQRSREPFDISLSRVKNTDAGQLVESGKLKLDPARVMEKKSVLNKKLFKDPIPPIKPKSKAPVDSNNSKGISYQVIFGANDKPSIRNPIKFSSTLPPQKIPLKTLPQGSPLTYWKSVAKVSPLQKRPSALKENIESQNSPGIVDDYFASSIDSRRSHAFDYLFDSKNLNTENIMHAFNDTESVVVDNGSSNVKKYKKPCCLLM
ncbi:uncharacterized protein [Lepeophtheirus salmonis]|nr:uncharacterized protein LOC121120238 [Lepeophtheirus salmonis]